MHRITALALVFSLLLTAVAWAKRSPPEPVAPLKSGNVEYRIDHSKMGTVEAWDLTHKAMLWRKQIYVVKFQPDLEKDIQDVYITTIQLKDKALLIANERKSEYSLDLTTLEVKVVKGVAVEETKIK